MTSLARIATCGLGVLLAAAPGASATDLLDRMNSERFRLNGRPAEAKALDDRLQLRQFQRREQNFREQTRETLQRPTERLDVPKMQRNCTLQIYGNNWSKSCR